MTKKKLAITLLCILLAAAAILTYGYIKGTPDKEFAYCQEYVSGTGNIKGDVDVEFWESLGVPGDTEAGRQANIVARFADFYMNSFPLNPS